MLQLTPLAAEDTPVLPDTNSDLARESPDVLELDAPLLLPERAITVVRVHTGRFTFNASINTLQRANRLVVTFGPNWGGAREGLETRRPRFARRHWDTLFQAPILAISDPLTEIGTDSKVLRTGFYMGTFADDLVPELLALIDKVCDTLDVPRDRVVMYGASAGGTSALLVGSRRSAATGIIAVNPYLRPDKFPEQAVALSAAAAGGDEDDWKRLTVEQPWRINPLIALRDGLNSGHDLRVVVAQNLQDKTTVNRHFPGLWRRFDIDPHGGVSPEGRIMAALYDDPEGGHGEESPAWSLPLVSLAYGFFDGPIVASNPKKARKGEKSRAADGEPGDDAAN